MSDHAVTIYVRVYDKDALFKAAIERSVQDGLPDWKPEDISDALRMLLDPGTSPPGVEILYSSCEGDPMSDDEFECPDPAGPDCHDDRCQLHYGDIGDPDEDEEESNDE